MTELSDKLTKAIEAKKNDVNSYVWKLARDGKGEQQEIKLVDATPEQLQSFYKHCKSMLYNTDKSNPGRYKLLELIEEQKEKCNTELFLRKLESGAICANKQPYPRYLYIQDIRTFMNAHKEDFPSSELKNISIATCTGGLPREFERISIDSVLNGGLDQLGVFNNKYINISFILSLGVYLTPQEMQELTEKDKDGKTRSRLEVIKERLKINPDIHLTVKSTGLNFNELRAVITLKAKKYSELTTDQLTVLRNKVLFKLEDKVKHHISQWEERMKQIEKVCEVKGIELESKNE